MNEEIYLPVEIAGVKFKNPFYVASGPTTKSVAQLKRIEETGWAAASIKLTIDPAPYINRVPRYGYFKDENALAFTAEKRLNFEQGLKLVDDAKKVLNDLILFANITYAGDKGIEGWVNMAKRFEDTGADIIELNMCCPNMSYNVELSSCGSESCGIQTGASLGQNGSAVGEIVKAIKEVVKIPVFVKLTPEGGKIAAVAKELYKYGADAVGGTSNRLGIPPINLEDPTSAIYHLQDEISMSCYSSAWLKPLSLRDTYEIRKVNGPDPKIMMAGGIKTWEDAIEMTMCGADLIGICSETLISGYGFIGDVIKGTKKYLDTHGYSSLSEIRDIVVPAIKSAPDLTLYQGYAEIKEANLMAPCKAACPNHIPVQAYVRKVAKGKFKEAYNLIMDKMPMQSTCAWICSAPCELNCTKSKTGRPVQIREIKKFVLEKAKEEGWEANIEIAPSNGKRVAIIGSGPAGISCAFTLKKAGFDVVVFEKDNKAGGMIRKCIPTFRIPVDIIDYEIDTLKKMDIDIKTGIKLGQDITIDSLKKDGFDAIFIATGAQKSKIPDIIGNDSIGIYTAIEFLEDIKKGKSVEVGDECIVLGGGFTAVDAARTLKRLGAKKVYMAYRRTKEEMPASIGEIKQAEDEGIKIIYLASPVEIDSKNGYINSVKLCTQTLGECDISGRRSPEEVCGANFNINCDMLVCATGQESEQIDVLGKGRIKANFNDCSTDIEGVFAAGDAVNVDAIITAAAGGRRGAWAIDKYINNSNATIEFEQEIVSVDSYDVLEREKYKKDEKAPVLENKTGAERISDFDIFERVMTEEEAVKEAGRCLNCGCGEGCGICAEICSEFAISLKAPDVWEIDSEKCVACGMCFNSCPNNNIIMINKGILV